MDAKTNLKAKLPSRHATEGPDRAPHRAFYYAMGLTTEQIHAPFVGVATCWNEAAPCNIALMRQAQAVKAGVASVGATAREFCTITVTDGIAMGHAFFSSLLHLPLLHFNQTGVVRHSGSILGNHPGGSQQIDASPAIRAPGFPRLQRIIDS